MSQVSYKGRSGELSVDYDEGFTLKDSQSGSIIFNKNFPGKDTYLLSFLSGKEKFNLISRARQQQ